MTGVQTATSFDVEEYQSLLREYLPHPIHSEADLDIAEHAVTSLLAKPTRSAAEDEILELLSELIETWEDDHEGVPDVHGVELVKLLLVDRDEPQRVLIPVFGTESIVSEVLSGRRQLQTKHILALGDFFGISPAAFLPHPVVS
jgi:HTH-type transcriptional regulator/antitoxin HigA